MNSKIKTYSKGMKQRLGIAQALLHDPEVIFLDEPTDGVDPLGRREIRELMGRLKDKGHTIFLNSHLLGEVELICDRVAILQRGRTRPRGDDRRTDEAEGARRDRPGGRAAVPRGRGQRARLRGQETSRRPTGRRARRRRPRPVGGRADRWADDRPARPARLREGAEPAAPDRAEAVAGRRVPGDGRGRGTGRGSRSGGKAVAVGGSDR